MNCMALGLSIDTNMKADLCVRIVKNARYGIVQSMNSAGGRCHDNARCESMWARMKEELFYCRGGSEGYTVEELKHIIWVYYMSYWNNRRICSSIGGIPPAVKRKRFFAESAKAVC